MTETGLASKWRANIELQQRCECHECHAIKLCASELDSAKLRLEQGVKALNLYPSDHEAVLKLLREL